MALDSGIGKGRDTRLQEGLKRGRVKDPRPLGIRADRRGRGIPGRYRGAGQDDQGFPGDISSPKNPEGSGPTKYTRNRYFPVSITGYPDHGEPQDYLTGLLLMPRLTSFSSGKKTA